LLEREAAVFKQISEDLNKETYAYRNQVIVMEQQLNFIKDFKAETEVLLSA